MKTKFKKPKLNRKVVLSLSGIAFSVVAVFIAVGYFNSDKYFINNTKAAGCLPGARNEKGICTVFQYESGLTVSYNEDTKNYTMGQEAPDGVYYTWQVDKSGNKTSDIYIYPNAYTEESSITLSKNARIRTLTGRYRTASELYEKYPGYMP